MDEETGIRPPTAADLREMVELDELSKIDAEVDAYNRFRDLEQELFPEDLTETR